MVACLLKQPTKSMHIAPNTQQLKNENVQNRSVWKKTLWKRRDHDHSQRRKETPHHYEVQRWRTLLSHVPTQLRLARSLDAHHEHETKPKPISQLGVNWVTYTPTISDRKLTFHRNIPALSNKKQQSVQTHSCCGILTFMMLRILNNNKSTSPWTKAWVITW